MSRYIDFEVDPSDPGLRGNPVHNGELPTRFLDVLGVRVSGEEITFLHEGVIEGLHRALVDGPKLVQSSGQGFDCVAFALLMSGVDLVQATGSREFTVDYTPDEDAPFFPNDTSQALPVAIAAYTRMHDDPEYLHVVVPAHTTEEAIYLHKLGDSGPVCISDLREAGRIVGGNYFAGIPSITVKIDDEQVAVWQSQPQKTV